MNNIEILENKIQCFRYMQNTLNDDEKELFEDGIQQEEIQAIENLIKENKELKDITHENIKYSNFLKKSYIERTKLEETINFLKGVLIVAKTGRDEKSIIQADLLKNIIKEFEKLLED